MILKILNNEEGLEIKRVFKQGKMSLRVSSNNKIFRGVLLLTELPVLKVKREITWGLGLNFHRQIHPFPELISGSIWGLLCISL